MLKSFLFALVAAGLMSNVALAKVVLVEDHRCVEASIERAHHSITDYEAYSRVPGARYQMKILGQGIDLLKMIKSQARYSVREDTRTDAFVWVVLQPVNITDSGFYPRLLLHCVSGFESATRFSHRCDMQPEKAHYSIQQFTSRLEVSSESLDCPKGQTRLDYTLQIDTIDEHVDAIKHEATRPFGPVLAPLIGAFFDADKFFRAYYTQYYASWADQL